MTSSDRVPAHHHRWSRRRAVQAGGAGFAASMLGGPVHARLSTPVATTDPPFPEQDQAILDNAVDGGLIATATPGALAGVWYPGRGTWRRAAGLGDIATATPMTLDDHVRIASITKTFTATVILQLVDEGSLAFDDVLEGFIPGVPNGADITLRQLLNMTAGIYNYSNDPVFADGYDADLLLTFTPDDALEIIWASTPTSPPGERALYSNSNYILLGMIAEQVTGQSIESLIKERILTPLELAQTSFPTTSAMPAPFAHGYDTGEQVVELRDVTRLNPGSSWASGAMISTLDDLAVWAAALANGTLLSPEIQAERLRFEPLPPARVTLGYGLGVINLNGLIGHSGDISGYSSWAMHDPDAGATIVVVTNRDGSVGTANPIFIDLARHLFPERFSAS